MTRARARRLVLASPSLLFGVLIGKLWLSGTLRYYINDRTVWIVLAGGVLFACVGIVGLWTAWHADHDHGGTWRPLLFLLAVLAGLVLPTHPLSASSGQASSLGSLQLASHIASSGSDDQFSTWVGDLVTHADPNWWAGQRVTLVGFATAQVGLPHRSFIVGRYLVTCCVVDATMFGFPAQLDKGRIPPQGAWVQVTGTFGHQYWTDPSGQHYPVIHHAHVSPVSIPSSPYLSP